MSILNTCPQALDSMIGEVFDVSFEEFEEQSIVSAVYNRTEHSECCV